MSDLDGQPADQTLVFAFGCIEYEIDLSADQADTFRDLMAPYITAARERRKTPSSSKLERRRRNGHETDNDAIRTWANANGIAVADRGRIPRSVVDRYRRAHGLGPLPAPRSAQVTSAADQLEALRAITAASAG